MYLLGPVGGGKSSLAERLKALMEAYPIYVLKAGDELSPVFESPLGLFNPERMGAMLEDRYGIPRRRLTEMMLLGQRFDAVQGEGAAAVYRACIPCSDRSCDELGATLASLPT